MKFEVNKIYVLGSELFRCKKIHFKNDGTSPITFEKVDKNGNVIVVKEKGIIKDYGIRLIYTKLSEMKLHN